MMWAGSVKVGANMETKDMWDTTEAEEFYRRYFGMDKEYSFADPKRDYKTVDEEKLKAGGMEVNLELIRNYQARQICKHCWALRTLGMCIYGFNKVRVHRTVFRKKFERVVIKHENEPDVVPRFYGVGDRKYNEMKKKIYRLYRKGVFRSRWTLYKLLHQLEYKYTKWEVRVSTWYEERWKFQGLEQAPFKFELVCPLKILHGKADFLMLWERDVWDFEPPHSLRRKRWGVGCWDNSDLPEVADHFIDQVIWDDDEREYIESDKVDNSETIETETETEEIETETEEEQSEYVCDNCFLRFTCEYAYDPYCKFECLADK